MIQTTFIPADLLAETGLHTGAVQSVMRRDGAGAMLVASNANIFYCACRFFRGYVYIPAEGTPIYFVMRPTTFENLPENVAYIRKPEQIPDMLSERGLAIPSSFALELDTLPYSDVERLRKLAPDAEIVNASPMLREARMTKTPWELDEMRKDGLHQAAAYRHIGRLYKSDMTDLEFQIEIERVLRLEGCLGFSRKAGSLMEINMGSVINGDNADTPAPYEFAMGGAGTDASLPGGADGSIMHSGTTVMVDMNGAFNGYQTDLTRVWRIGDIPEIAVKAHECSRRILRELEQIATPGTEVCELYRRAEAIVKEEELEDYFMGHRQKAGFIGHGVGIELNEQPPVTPRNKLPLKEGMTLALEPKFVIPHVGAVGVENTYAVTPSGLECLTPFPEEIGELI